MADLVDPKVGYKTIRDDFITMLEANLTALNVGLNKTFADGTDIKGGNPFTTDVFNFPTILVAVLNKSENFHAITKDKAAIVSLVAYAMARNFDSSQADEDEAMTLVDNIEGLLRVSDANVQFSTKIQYSQPTDTDFFYGKDETSTYVAIASILIECVVEVQ